MTPAAPRFSYDDVPPAPWTAHYQPGVPERIELPTDSLVAMLERSVAEAGDAIALDLMGATTTYRELGEQVARAAAGLAQLGVGAGDRVVIMLPNCPQHVIAFYAVLRLGAVVVEHNPLYTVDELRPMLADHGARHAIVWDKAADKLTGLPAGEGPETVVSVNLLHALPRTKRLALALPLPALRRTRAKLHAAAPGTIAWDRLLRHAPLPADHPRPGVDDLAVIQYTSGTTGRPRGAMLTHLNLHANALQGEAWMHGAQYREEVFYALLPMFHAFGMTLYLTYGILKQSRLVLFPSFDVDMVLDAAKRIPPTVYCAVPPIYERTARAARERGIDLTSAKYCISGAMKLNDSTVAAWEEVSGGLLVEGYGMTEASPVALGNPFWPTRRTGTIGVPFPSTWMRVADPEDPSRDVAPGEPGELLIMGPQVFQGYWNDAEATAAALHEGRWLRTGDIVTVDEDGFATIVDRLKELIITGGFNVSPSEVEAVLETHPAIAEAAVVGVDADGRGEQVMAAVVLAEGAAGTAGTGAAALDEAEVREYCREHLARYKVPRRIIVVDELPHSMLGKVMRRQVREQVEREIGTA